MRRIIDLFNIEYDYNWIRPRANAQTARANAQTARVNAQTARANANTARANAHTAAIVILLLRKCFVSSFFRDHTTNSFICHYPVPGIWSWTLHWFSQYVWLLRLSEPSHLTFRIVHSNSKHFCIYQFPRSSGYCAQPFALSQVFACCTTTITLSYTRSRGFRFTRPHFLL